MAVADIQDEIFDILTPPQIRQQILGIVLCLEVPLFPFAMLVTELTHTLLYLHERIRALRRSRCAEEDPASSCPQSGLPRSFFDPFVCWSNEVYEIPSSKHQITNKSQIPISNDQNSFGILKLGTRPQGGESKRSADNFGHCDLFGICDL